jgi:hypothetical protein
MTSGPDGAEVADVDRTRPRHEWDAGPAVNPVPGGQRTADPEPHGRTAATPDETDWGFHAIDGLPDLEETPPSGTGAYRRFDLPRLSSGEVAVGLGDEFKDELARRRTRFLSWQATRAERGDRAPELSPYELEAAEAMTARRDAAVRLQTVLADDVSQYEGGMAAIRAGLAKDILVPPVGGTIRRGVSEAMAELEAARHRFRLALVAVGIDNGMTAGQIGAAFGFSRQLASRYLKEAHAKWPGLPNPTPARRT